MPQWMADWKVSHPGFKESTQLENEDIDELCKDAKTLEEDVGFFNEGEEEFKWDFKINNYTIPSRDTVYTKFRFNFPVRYLKPHDTLYPK